MARFHESRNYGINCRPYVRSAEMVVPAGGDTIAAVEYWEGRLWERGAAHT